ncbi:MAG: succinylglutamate desuccinylase/aspartoacylase family protein [Acidobacteriota bacterium]
MSVDSATRLADLSATGSPVPIARADGSSATAFDSRAAVASRRQAAAPRAWRRRIGRAAGPQAEEAGAPTLVVLGGIHGNEPSGYLALERVFAALAADDSALLGTLVGFGGNLQALEQGHRFLRHDLNRHWTPERVARLRASEGPLEAEDAELRLLDREIGRVLADAPGEVFGMDLHTTSGQGPCFTVLDDTLPNRAFAIRQPATLVVGLEEELAGTVTNFMALQGMRVYGFEAGQHDDPASVDRAEAAIWVAMESAGVVEKGRPEVSVGRELLEREAARLPHVVEVVYRHPVLPSDDFVMEPGYVNFQRIHGGEILARDRRGPVLACESGRILMPLYQPQGEDGFFIVRPVARLWLSLSALVRRLGLQRGLHLLPGVRRHPELPDTFVADRRLTVFFASELFHLLGYRRRGPAGRYLVMTRRPHDR